MPPELARGNIVIADPVAAREWGPMGHALNYLLGRGSTLVPWHCPNDTLVASATGTYRYTIWPRRACSHRLWLVALKVASGFASVTFTDPSGGASTWDVAIRSTGAVKTFVHVETVSSPTSSETTIAPTIAVASGSSDTQVLGVACFEVPRLALPGDATELGVDVSTLLTDTPIYNDTGVSIGGLSALLDDARDIAQRSSIFAWAVTSAGAFSTTSGTAVDIFNGNVSALGRSLYNGDTVRTVEARAYVRAGATTAGTVQLAMASGDTLNLSIPSGSSGEWVTGQIDVHAEDLSAADGRRSSTWDEIGAKLVRTSGANSVYIESLILGRG